MSTNGLFGLYTYGCPEGYEPENLISGIVPLCYPKCPVGFQRFSFLCVSTCNNIEDPSLEVPTDPPTLINSGNDWHDRVLSCEKRLYDRGIGLIPDACAAGSNRSIFMSMCYTNCPQGLNRTTWAPTVCSQQCPANTVEAGFANCTKVNEYGRGGGNKGLGCPSGFTDMGLHCHNWNVGPRFGWTSGYECNTSGCNSYAPLNDPPSPDGSHIGTYYYSSPFYTIPDQPGWWTHTYNGNPVTPILWEGDVWYNTRRAIRNNQSCQQSTDGLCYPQCDIGYHNFGCCVCTPSCGALADHGATCSRRSQDVGAGIAPNACSDEERQVESGLCYNLCQSQYNPWVTTCTRGGCPYGGERETALSCFKGMRVLGGAKPGIPNFADKINEKISVGTIQAGARRIAMNAIVITICAIFIVLLIYMNLTLRSRPHNLPSNNIILREYLNK